MNTNHQPIYLRAVGAGTRPCNQHGALASGCKIRREIFDCAIKEGSHYDLARTICMLYSTESEWGSNQLYSLSRQLIGMWSDTRPAEVPPLLPGRLTTLHTPLWKKKKNLTSAAGPSLTCVQTCPLQNTHQTKKQSMCNAWWCCRTMLISSLKHFKWAVFVYSFLTPKNVAA